MDSSIRPTSQADIEGIVRLLNTSSIADAIYWVPVPYSHDDALAWVKRAEVGGTDKSEFLYSIVTDHDQYIGSVNLHRLDNEGLWETGYWLDPEYQGRGYAYRGLEMAIKMTSQQVPVKRIIATTAMNNISSQKLLEKAGFVCTGKCLVKAKDGRNNRESFIYAMRPGRQSLNS